MLSNNLKKASSILSTRCFHRCLASAAAPPTSPTSEKDDINKTQEPSPPKPGAPRGIPTRHSRHNEPLVAPVETLDESCQRIIASTPGTLFSYNPKNLHQSKMEEYEQALSECHSLQQKIEYLLRGYSAQLPGSLVNLTLASPSSSSNDMNSIEIIHKMMQLLTRIEMEGKAYVELRSKYRSQLAHISDPNDASSANTNSNVNIDTNVDETTNNNNHAWKMTSLVTNFGAPPGPTNAMYDLILDAIAVSVSISSSSSSSSEPNANAIELLETLKEVHQKSLHRYELDVKAGVEMMNPSSCPTPVTFNAVIRAAGNAAAGNSDKEQVRDYAMENAFFAFDAMYHHPVVHRNSSTYRYMLDMIGAVFPVGEVRGNIAAVMWEKAVQDKVVDVPLFEAMKKVGSEEHGELFDGWWKSTEAKFVEGVNGNGFPIVWGKNKKLRRFDRKMDSY